jgi:feruloyl-CoA synthase
VRRIGEALLARGLDATKPVALLSDNSIEHALLSLGAMHAGRARLRRSRRRIR